MARYPLFQTCASFALLLAASVMASASPVDLPDVTVQAHVVEEGESDLHTHTTSGSRLELSALQTPASTTSLSGAEVRERNNRSVQDAVTRTPGISSIGSPGNGGTALSARGFTGHAATMQLYDGTRQYVGAGTVTFQLVDANVAWQALPDVRLGLELNNLFDRQYATSASSDGEQWYLGAPRAFFVTADYSF